jgi:hypothetical protein
MRSYPASRQPRDFRRPYVDPRHSEPPPGGVRAPGSADQGEAHVFCRVHSPGMGTQLSSMLKDLPPIPSKRLCYRAEAPDDQAVKHLSRLTAPPEGCEVRPADKDLFGPVCPTLTRSGPKPPRCGARSTGS